MALQIRLLGVPAIVRDDAPVRLPGRKTWALLAMLAVEARPIPRQRLVERLSAEADDPQAALRWLLHAVRRALGSDAEIVDELGGLRLACSSDTLLDVRQLLSHESDDVDLIALCNGEFLAGMQFDDSPGLALWIEMERSRLRNTAAEALWHRASVNSASNPDEAIRLVRHGLAMDPYCETKHELIIDLHLQRGDVQSARAHAEAARRMFRDELGIEVPETILRPLERRSAHARVAPGPTIRARLQAAEARLAAGDAEHAIEIARRAADEALRADDQRLELASLMLLSRVLVHGRRGRHIEAKGLLSRAAQLASALADRPARAEIERELGYALLLEGNYGAADRMLARSGAEAVALGDSKGEGQAATYRGMSRSDQCDFEAAAALFKRAIERFSASSEPGWHGFAEAMLARSLLRAGDPAAGHALATAARERIRAAGWTAVLPWPILVEAECIRRQDLAAPGDAINAADGFAEALELASEIGDAVFESLALRGLALTRIDVGDQLGAARYLEDALSAVRRFSETYAWAEAVVLVDLVELGAGRNPRHVADAFRLAAEGPMPDLAARLLPWRGLPTAQTLLQTAAV
jgi:DNA-binding SARP family transcriptional activator